MAATTATDEPSVIGLRVMRARRRRGWSQTRLAAELGRSDRWVRLLESGELPWVRRIEDGCSPAPHDLRVLTQLAEVLELDLADLMRAPDVVAPSAVIATPMPYPDHTASVSAPERPATPAPGRPLPRTGHRVARLGHGRARMLDAMASPLVLIGSATLALGAVAATAAAGVLTPASHPSASLSSASGPRGALAMTPAQSLGPLSPPARRSVTPVQPVTTIAPPTTPAVAPPPPITTAVRLDPATVAAAARPAGGVATLSATLINFGAVRAGSTVSRTVTLTNTGTRPVHIGFPMVLMATDLTISTDCTGRTLAPGQRCSITETFAPGGPTSVSALVMLADDTPQGREVIDVRGTSP